MQVHGFIFVVDSTDPQRMGEAKDALKEFLRSDKVRGKPVLLLCNKTDVETAEEMDSVVDTLNVERFVNEARCPTRVDRTVANKAEGLRDGFKWLAKSVIANLADLGPRVDADVEAQRRAEARKREELRRRIEERKRLEGEEEEDGGGGGGEGEAAAARGFVALSEIRDQWAGKEADRGKEKEKERARRKKKAAKSAAGQNGVVLSAPALYKEPERSSTVEKLPKINEEGHQRRHRQGRDNNDCLNKQMTQESCPGSPPPPTAETRPSAPPAPTTVSNGGAFGNLPSLDPESCSFAAAAASVAMTSLELEPVSQPKKKRNLMKRLSSSNNSRTSPMKTMTTATATSAMPMMPATPAVRSAFRAGSLGSSKSVSSAESLRDSQVIKAYS